MSSEDNKTETLVIIVSRLKNRKCFKYLGSGGHSRKSLTARELTSPKHSPGVDLVIKQKGKPDIEVLVWNPFTVSTPTGFGKKLSTLKPSMYKVGTKLVFTAQSTSVPGTGYDPLPEFAINFWAMLTTNPDAPIESAFEVTELVGQSW